LSEAFARFARSYTGRLLLGTMLIHVILIPLLFIGIVQYAAREYQAQFVNHVRSQAFLLSANLNQVTELGNIDRLKEDLLLSGQITYAEFIAPTGTAPLSAPRNEDERFQEDFFFGEHGDHVYYIAIPIRGGDGGILRVGFDESPVEENIRGSYRLGIFLTIGYVATTLALIGFFGHLLTISIRSLRDASRRIADGHFDEQLVVNTSITEISSLAEDLELMREGLIRREHEIALREARQRAVLETAAEGIITVTPEGLIESFNKAAEVLFDFRADELIGRPFEMLLLPQEAAKFYTPAGQPGICSAAEFRGRDRTGREFHLMLSVSEAVAGSSRCFTLLVQDISERLAFEARLAHMATHDALTTLPNRSLYADRLAQMLAHAARDNHIVAVMFIDLDRFKIINDTLGHDVGDEMLQAAAQRLKCCIRDEDTLARMGGDEFTVVLPQLQHADSATLVAKKILDELEHPFVVAGKELFISCSVGIALYPYDGLEAGDLAKNADVAMYAAKNQGGNAYQFYSQAMNAKASIRLEMDSSLRYALERGELVLYYQPQVDVNTMRIEGVEALLRWRHPVRGLVPPADFIPLAEESGIIVPISEWVLRTACAQAKAWMDQGSEVTVGVNLSAVHFGHSNLFDAIRSVLEETGLRPGLLDLELTESTVMVHGEETIAILQRLKALGVSLSLDDFGTGYSSLAYLTRFPIDTLKIDRSFINEITREESGLTLVSTIIAMAHSLRMHVVAEGVDSAEQLRLLRDYRCGTFQGYYFSEPLPADAMTELLRKNLGPAPGAGRLCVNAQAAKG
jgi:diguanylate cyclase (GGDEF)-like protein/PAS domain S-box-containing protein